MLSNTKITGPGSLARIVWNHFTPEPSLRTVAAREGRPRRQTNSVKLLTRMSASGRAVDGPLLAETRHCRVCPKAARDRWPPSQFADGTDRAGSCSSDLGLLRNLQGVIDLDAKIANGRFQLGMSEQQLHSAQVLGSLVNQRCLGRTECVP